MSSERKIRVANIKTTIKSSVIQIEVTHFDNRKAYALTGYVAEGVGSGMIRIGLSTIHSEIIEPAPRYSEKKLKAIAAGFDADHPRVIALAEKIAKSAGVTLDQPEMVTIDVVV
jgi:hypothetical protein